MPKKNRPKKSPPPPRLVLPGQRALTAGERLQLAELRICELMRNQSELHDAICAIGHYVGTLERVVLEKGLATTEEVEAIAKQLYDEREDKPDTRVCRECGCTPSEACSTPVGPCSWAEADLCSACVAKAEAKFKEFQDAEARPMTGPEGDA